MKIFSRFPIFVGLALLVQLSGQCYASDWVEDESVLPPPAATDTNEATDNTPNVTDTGQLPPQSKPDPDPDQSGGVATTIGTRLTTAQKVAAMEEELFGKTRSGMEINKRVDLLEEKILTQTDSKSAGSLIDRINMLYQTLNPSDRSKNRVTQEQKNTFLNPPDCPWLNSLGRGLKQGGSSLLSVPRAFANEARYSLSSGEVMEDAMGTAGLYSGFNMMRSNYYPSYPTYPSYPSYSIPSNSSHYVQGYSRNGTYVQGHWSTNPNSSPFDNYSNKGNLNPFTGKPGWITP